jgi:DNA (cytosine-5)-methyltransferase 1
MRTLDIFCGGGGSSFGARAAGADISCGIDLDSIATATFKENFPNAHVVKSRLENVRLSRLRDKIGDIDLLLASPECTNHTCAKGSAPRSEESRATALQTIRFAKAFQPRWIILENVVHMKPWARFEELKDRLSALGYNINEEILDASEFGVPQRRRRLFLICDREEIPKILPKRRVTRRKTVKSILDRPGLWKTTQLYSDKRAAATLERAERAFSNVGQDAPFLIVYYGTDGCGGWQKLDRPLRTITTVDRFALVQPGEEGHTMRMLQVPELQRAMGFTKEFSLIHGTRRDKVRLLGNGVCPPVMSGIVSRLMTS